MLDDMVSEEIYDKSDPQMREALETLLRSGLLPTHTLAENGAREKPSIFKLFESPTDISTTCGQV